MGFVMMYIYLPVFHDLKLTSTYQVWATWYIDLICGLNSDYFSLFFCQYLQARFDKKMRLFGCILFIFSQVWSIDSRLFIFLFPLPINPWHWSQKKVSVYRQLVSGTFCLSWRVSAATTKGSSSFEFYIIHEEHCYALCKVTITLSTANFLEHHLASIMMRRTLANSYLLIVILFPRWCGFQSSFLCPLWHSIKVRIHSNPCLFCTEFLFCFIHHQQKLRQQSLNAPHS